MKTANYIFFAICIGVIGLAIAAPGPGGIMEAANSVLKRIDKQPFLVYMPPGSDVEAGAKQLYEILSDGDTSQVAIVVGSSDTEMMAQIMIGALTKLEPNSLTGTDIVFVGDKKNRKEIRRLAKEAGITLRFRQYKE